MFPTQKRRIAIRFSEIQASYAYAHSVLVPYSGRRETLSVQWPFSYPEWSANGYSGGHSRVRKVLYITELRVLTYLLPLLKSTWNYFILFPLPSPNSRVLHSIPWFLVKRQLVNYLYRTYLCSHLRERVIWPMFGVISPRDFAFFSSSLFFSKLFLTDIFSGLFARISFIQVPLHSIPFI